MTDSVASQWWPVATRKGLPIEDVIDYSKEVVEYSTRTDVPTDCKVLVYCIGAGSGNRRNRGFNNLSGNGGNAGFRLFDYKDFPDTIFISVGVGGTAGGSKEGGSTSVGVPGASYCYADEMIGKQTGLPSVSSDHDSAVFCVGTAGAVYDTSEVMTKESTAYLFEPSSSAAIAISSFPGAMMAQANETENHAVDIPPDGIYTGGGGTLTNQVTLPAEDGYIETDINRFAGAPSTFGGGSGGAPVYSTINTTLTEQGLYGGPGGQSVHAGNGGGGVDVTFTQCQHIEDTVPQAPGGGGGSVGDVNYATSCDTYGGDGAHGQVRIVYYEGDNCPYNWYPIRHVVWLTGDLGEPLTGVPKSIEVQRGQQLDLTQYTPDAPQGKVFGGWYENADQVTTIEVNDNKHITGVFWNE